ncbi:hypothetical protein ALC62_13136 [Cyphomyrmex costatus]|uniref:Uncharacterized protein n=1 Tax=Cyphomyrmex costatus TaxID=456900 RepID=A0A195C624_9HYME|nr:hypothetical protein ALC62_13136 [Cyphomyrmex costatus]
MSIIGSAFTSVLTLAMLCAIYTICALRARKNRGLSTCLLHDDILHRFYSDNDSRSLAHNDWVDTDVRR